MENRPRNIRIGVPPTLDFFYNADSNIGENILNTTMNNSPVVIRPSLSQIRRATRVASLRDISYNIENDLPICPIDREIINENDSVMQIIECGHFFRDTNLRIHFTMSARCPLCRFDIRDYINDYNTTTAVVDVENPFDSRPSSNINPVQEMSRELINSINDILNEPDASNNVMHFEYSIDIELNTDTANES